MASYFQGEKLNTGKADTFTANMSVAELIERRGRLADKSGYASHSMIKPKLMF